MFHSLFYNKLMDASKHDSYNLGIQKNEPEKSKNRLPTSMFKKNQGRPHPTLKEAPQPLDLAPTGENLPYH